MAHFDAAWLIQSSDDRILATPHWRQHAARVVTDALMNADSGRSYTKAAYARLSFHADRMPDGEALSAIRRTIRVMSAFAALSSTDRDVLEGKLPYHDTWKINGNQALALRIERERLVWQSHPALAELRAELDAEAERAAEAQRQELAAHDAKHKEAMRGWNAAPGIVLDLHDRGIRLTVQDGRAVAFPASRLTPEDVSFLANHNAVLATAISAELTA